MAAKKSTASASKTNLKEVAAKAPTKVNLKKPATKAPTKRATRAPAKKPAGKAASKKPAAKAAATTRGGTAARTRAAGKSGKGRAIKRLGAADAHEVALRLASAIPEPGHELSFRTPFELLIATILAAQSTDRTVNQVMPTLLARFPGARELAESTQDEVELLVKRTGFFRNKARSIRETAQQLVATHGGEVPKTMDELIELQGVARKTANVVLGTAYGIQAGFIVDTHVSRVTQRLGLTRQSDPGRIEAELCRTFEQSSWTDLGHRFTLHGRYTCTAKQPLCSDCPINELCGSRESEPADVWQGRAQREGARVNEGIRVSRGGSPVGPDRP